jgi:hypothetical protein
MYVRWAFKVIQQCREYRWIPTERAVGTCIPTISYTDSDPVELGAAQTVEACLTEQAWLGRRCRIANAV